MSKVRAFCDPSVVIVQWDGDMHNEPEDNGRGWYVELGRVCDCNLTVETGYQARYAALGVLGLGLVVIAVVVITHHRAAAAAHA